MKNIETIRNEIAIKRFFYEYRLLILCEKRYQLMDSDNEVDKIELALCQNQYNTLMIEYNNYLQSIGFQEFEGID